jgi:hypothetical protein
LLPGVTHQPFGFVAFVALRYKSAEARANGESSRIPTHAQSAPVLPDHQPP